MNHHENDSARISSSDRYSSILSYNNYALSAKKKSAGFEHADFPLRYNFPPLSIRITSWIAKKKVSLEEMVRKKSWIPGDFFLSASCVLL